MALSRLRRCAAPTRNDFRKSNRFGFDEIVHAFNPSQSNKNAVCKIACRCRRAARHHRSDPVRARHGGSPAAGQTSAAEVANVPQTECSDRALSPVRPSASSLHALAWRDLPSLGALHASLRLTQRPSPVEYGKPVGALVNCAPTGFRTATSARPSQAMAAPGQRVHSRRRQDAASKRTGHVRARHQARQTGSGPRWHCAKPEQFEATELVG